MNFLINPYSSDEEGVPNRRRRRRRLPRVFRPRTNMYFRTEFEFNERFRLSAIKLEEILQNIGSYLVHPTQRSEALSAKLQLCIGLHWLGSGSQYHCVGDMHGVSKASVCQAVHAIVEAIYIKLYHQTIKWPENISETVSKFFEIAGMPLIVGCIDGTLINIDSPNNNEMQYVDRHGKHSINCMAVCGPDCQFYYISARWPGSVHDSRVLRNSMLFAEMEAGRKPLENGVILGDSGYPLLDWLLTPTGLNAEEPAVRTYNRVHKSTRRIVENSFGILKEKFPCLNYMRLQPEFACKVFICCAILCNISRSEEDVNNVVLQVQARDGDLEEENEIEQVVRGSGARRLQEMIEYFE